MYNVGGGVREPGQADMEGILIIEDEPDVADFVRRDLLQSGFDVEIAHTGQQGLEIAYSTHPDLIVLDLVLPDMDGIDLCRELRRQPSDSPEVEESLERTAIELRRLIRMTNNLLLNAQLESKPALLPQPVNLRELVEAVIKDMQVLAGGRDLKLKLEERGRCACLRGL